MATIIRIKKRANINITMYVYKKVNPLKENIRQMLVNKIGQTVRKKKRKIRTGNAKRTKDIRKNQRK